jgi:hypothetical protein
MPQIRFTRALEKPPMKTIATGLAALTLATAITTGAPHEARADILVLLGLGVGSYFIADAAIGCQCCGDERPFRGPAFAYSCNYRSYYNDGFYSYGFRRHEVPPPEGEILAGEDVRDLKSTPYKR